LELAVKASNLSKKYGTLLAVNDVSFSIWKGEIFGLLGPNGAGKTTTIEMIEGLRKPDSGKIEILGVDAAKEPDRIKQMIGVQLQTTTLYDKIRVEEVIRVFGSYYKRSLPVSVVLEEVSLKDKKDSYVSALSGGQKQRLAMALALVNDPEILFLDEPTTGLDPQARHNVWNIIDKLRSDGKTIILSTHYMEEAESLCQRVGIMDRGKIIAMDSPLDLIAHAGLESRIEFTSPHDVKSILDKLTGIGNISAGAGNKYVFSSKRAVLALKDLTQLCYEKNIDLENISVKKASLEDVFLSLTGRDLRE